MRIGIQSWGSMGDLRPMLCLGHALVRAGHQVVFAATAVDGIDHGQTCARLGMEWLAAPCPLTLDLSRLRQDLVSKQPLGQLATLVDTMLTPALGPMREASFELCASCEVVVGHFLVHPLRVAALRSRRPQLSVAFWPGMVPTPEQPPWPLPSLGRLGNRLSWQLARTLINRTLLPRLAGEWLRAGLPPPRDVMRDCWYAPLGTLLACSPQLYARSRPWPGQHLVGAFDRLPEDTQAVLPQAVESFLAEGPPPLLLTLGSAQLLDPDGALELLIAAATLVGCRALINTTSARFPVGTREGRLCFSGPLNHALVMPRCAAVLHHGGAGTSHAATRAGRASQVLGFIDEQMAWGWTLHRRGVAPPPLRYRRVTAPILAQRLQALLADTAMQRRAQDLGGRMAGEDGATAAVAVITAAVARGVGAESGTAGGG